ncbi:lamin tail domain-containing protein [Candidatus Kaiserbacteria bacterium]|nr:lamin tail domain-containing protein [Candidatus Kaiserbacteria bacterium]
MRIAGLFTLVMCCPIFVHAAVVINEIAWMGTAANANAEWLELMNTGSTAVDLTNWHVTAVSGSPTITLAGSIAANGYFLLERTADTSVPAVTADQIYTGALTNSGTTITLTDAGGNTSDQVVGGANWVNVGGDNASKETAQRTASGWETAVGTPRARNAGVTEISSSPVSSDTSSSTTTTVSSSSTGSPDYIPIPTLRIVTNGSKNISSGADTAFTATVYDSKGNKRIDALIAWSFGDGMRRIGASVFHAYYDPGEYLAVVHASTSDGGDALAEMIITVKDANITIASISVRGISLINKSTRTLDLSLWRLSMGGKEFKIPEDTQILAGRTILFPVQVTQLPLANSAVLLYPSGEVATTYPAEVAIAPTNAPTQPLSVPISYKEVQAIEYSEVAPLISKTDIQTHEEAVDAPTASTELAAVGAASTATTPPLENSRPTGIFNSPWTLGFLGVVVLAGVAFIFL